MTADSSLVNKTLLTSGIRKEFGVIIVGIKKEDGQLFNPEPTTLIVGGDILITLGEPAAIGRLEKLATSKGVG